MLVIVCVVICLQLKVKHQVTMEESHSLLKVSRVEIFLKAFINILVDQIVFITNQCVKRCEDLKIQKQPIQVSLQKQSAQVKVEYKNHLNAYVDIARLLLYFELPFWHRDESEISKRKDSILTFFDFYAKKNCVDSVVLQNAPKNNQMTCSLIQKDIANGCHKETIKAILEELGDDYFAILVDKSHDVSCKQQMTIVLRYGDKRNFVMECLVGLAQVICLPCCLWVHLV